MKPRAASEIERADNRNGAVIRLDAVSRRFRVGSSEITAVNEVSLTIDSGDWVALTGASGSGKSTLLHIIGAIERADAGSVTVDGVDITGLSRGELARYRQGVGFVFQRFHLLAAASALDNVIAPLAPLRVAFDKVSRARELLDAVGLSGRERSLPSQLSGGQQQRVAIARALVNHPRLLLADEPTGNLDSTTSAEIVELLLTLRRQLGTTVLFATHEAALAASAKRVITLRDGQIINSTAGG